MSDRKVRGLHGSDGQVDSGDHLTPSAVAEVEMVVRHYPYYLYIGVHWDNGK